MLIFEIYAEKVSLEFSLKTILYRNHCRIDMSNSRQQFVVISRYRLFFFKMHVINVNTQLFFQKRFFFE